VDQTLFIQVSLGKMEWSWALACGQSPDGELLLYPRAAYFEARLGKLKNPAGATSKPARPD